MAASTTSPLPVAAPSPSIHAVPAPQVTANRRRRINPEAGHALEILGHAIEYLTDELVEEGGAVTSHDSRVEAIQLLMALNRQVYFECPVVPSLRERWLGFLKRD